MRCSLSLLAVAAAVCVLPAPAAVAAAPQPKVDLSGIWIGTTDADPPQYKSTGFPSPPPFTEEGARMSKHWADPKTNQGSLCLPGGGPAGSITINTLFPIEIIQRPEQVTILYEYLEMARRVYMTETSHPKDLEKTWMGHSYGRWEGDTLVVDTVGVHAGPINGSGTTVEANVGLSAEPRIPYSETLHLVEHFRSLAGGQYLVDELTVEDPTLYTHPFTYKRFFRHVTDFKVLEYVCAENTRLNDEKNVQP